MHAPATLPHASRPHRTPDTLSKTLFISAQETLKVAKLQGSELTAVLDGAVDPGAGQELAGHGGACEASVLLGTAFFGRSPTA